MKLWLCLALTLRLHADDLELAKSVLRDIGADIDGSSGRCAQCHDVSARQIENWGKTMLAAEACLERRDRHWYQRLQCLFDNPAQPEIGYHAKRLGLGAIHPRSPQTEALFREAYGNDFQSGYDWFLRQTSMPPGETNAISDERFEALRSWVKKGMPHLYDLITEAPGIPECSTTIRPTLIAELDQLQRQNWSIRHREQLLDMAACTDNNPLACFKISDRSTYTDAAKDSLSASWVAKSQPGAYRILLRDMPLQFWIRSSADGRFIGTVGKIYDIQDGLQPIKEIELPAANLDPNFAPDMSHFSYLNRREKPIFCPMNLLWSARHRERIDLDAFPCRTFSDMQAYLFLGSSLSGGLQLSLTGTHHNDLGTRGEDPPGRFTSLAEMDFAFFNGTDRLATQSLASPQIGDWALSPSAKLAAGRKSNSASWNSNHGYEILGVETAIVGGRPEVRTTSLGSVCMRGAKATFSYDERMIVTHHQTVADEHRSFGYSSASDPEFREMVRHPTTNIYLADLTTGKQWRLTTMQPGQRAVFPHFRSDGWLYFAVQDKTRNQVYLVATDAALRLQETQSKRQKNKQVAESRMKREVTKK